MRRIYHTLVKKLNTSDPLVLATVLDTRGSAPQVPGVSAVFSGQGLRWGTLGGGILEGDATRKAAEAIRTGKSAMYEFDLAADINEEEGAICGGAAIILIDANPLNSHSVFRELEKSLSQGKPGILATILSGEDQPKVERIWLDSDEKLKIQIPDPLNAYQGEIFTGLKKRNCIFIRESKQKAVFIEPVFPVPKLIVAGAGHVGKALAHMASLLDFEITVIDDRPEHANPDNLPDADHIIMDNIGKAIQNISKPHDTFVVIVTRGHRDDADALRACIGSDLAYIGMIGSKKKIQLMREQFISRGWATAEEFDRVHAPVGLKIGSRTVQEIALSICAELVQVRSSMEQPDGKTFVSAVILAAGESRRMGKPKMLLPFGEKSMIERVIDHALQSAIDRTVVVLGSDHQAIGSMIQDYPVEMVINSRYKNGMLSSLQCGLKAVPDQTDAVMVLLGDQPMIGTSVMDRMIQVFRGSDKKIIVATHQGKRGHPLLFGRQYIQEIMEYTNRNSPRDILMNHPGDILEMETGSPAILRDIDTEKDYKQELKHQYNYG